MTKALECKNVLRIAARPAAGLRGAHLFAAACLAEQEGDVGAALLLLRQFVALSDSPKARETLAFFIVTYGAALGEDLVLISRYAADVWPLSAL